jgi:hypothetical protein
MLMEVEDKGEGIRSLHHTHYCSVFLLKMFMKTSVFAFSILSRRRKLTAVPFRQ